MPSKLIVRCEKCGHKQGYIPRGRKVGRFKCITCGRSNKVEGNTIKKVPLGEKPIQSRGILNTIPPQ